MIVPSFLSRALWSAAVVLGFCAVPIFSTAQVTKETPPVPATPVPPEVAPIDERKIDQFAEAYVAIEEIHAETAVELETVKTQATADAVMIKAEERLIQAVERSGLKLDEFNQIAERTAKDVELRARIGKKVEDRRRI